MCSYNDTRGLKLKSGQDTSSTSRTVSGQDKAIMFVPGTTEQAGVAASPPASPLPLHSAGWQHNAEGAVVDGVLRCTNESLAPFKHSQAIGPGDVLRMRVEAGKTAIVGLAGEGLDIKRYGETWRSTALVNMRNGTTANHADLSLDRQYQGHHCQLRDQIPKAPFDLALRCDGNVPQIQFNEDGVWHGFAPEGGAALKAGPWFPFLELHEGDLVADFRKQPCPRHERLVLTKPNPPTPQVVASAPDVPDDENAQCMNGNGAWESQNATEKVIEHSRKRRKLMLRSDQTGFKQTGHRYTPTLL